jgi:hypothetical protein
LRYFGEHRFDFDTNPNFEFLTPGEKKNKGMRSGTNVARVSSKYQPSSKHFFFYLNTFRQIRNYQGSPILSTLSLSLQDSEQY